MATLEMDVDSQEWMVNILGLNILEPSILEPIFVHVMGLHVIATGHFV